MSAVKKKCLQRRLETVQGAGRRVANGAWQPVPCRRTCDDECTSAELCPGPLNYKVAASRRDNVTMQIITGTPRPTALPWLPVLSHVAPLHLRRQEAAAGLLTKIELNDSLIFRF